MFGNSLKGILHVNGTSAAGSAGTDEQVLMTYSLPAGALKRNGQNLRVRAWYTTGANGNNKTFKLYFGSVSLSTGTLTDNAKAGALQLDVVRIATDSQTVLATGVVDTTNLACANTAATEDDGAAIVIKLTGTGGTSGVDCIAKGLVVEMGQEA